MWRTQQGGLVFEKKESLNTAKGARFQFQCHAHNRGRLDKAISFSSSRSAPHLYIYQIICLISSYFPAGSRVRDRLRSSALNLTPTRVPVAGTTGTVMNDLSNRDYLSHFDKKIRKPIT